MSSNNPIADVVVCGTSAVVRLHGEIDIANLGELSRALLAARAATTHLTIELSDVEFIDWTATALILGTINDIQGQGGSAAVAGARAQVRRMFFLLGLDGLLTA